MGKYMDLIGYSTGTGTSFAAMTGSPYSPQKTGRLVGLVIVLSRQANTSIAWAGEVRIKSSSFGGVDCQVPFNGIGEAAADIVEAAGGVTIFGQDQIDLAVSLAKITVEYRYQVTPTTPELYVYGIFEG